MKNLKFLLNNSKRQANITTDVIGEYPKNIDVPALAERKSMLTTRAFALGMYLSLSLNIILAFVIYSLAPLKEKIPMLITVNDKTNQLVRVEPFPSKGIEGFDLLVELAIKDYILHRESISIYDRENNFNWSKGGYIENRSDAKSYQVFSRQMPAYEEAYKIGIRREVEIIPNSLEKITSTYWVAQFKTLDIDSNANQEIGVRYWKVKILIDFRSKEINYQDRFMNPLGFTVTEYTVVPKDSPKN